jgi:forkhead transcription factor HCM1
MMSTFKTVAQKPVVDGSMGFGGKENVQPTLYPAPTSFTLNVEQYYQKAPGKRALLEAAPIKDARPAKRTKLDEPTLPPHDSFPVIVDDGAKPGHSYAQLIGMAILRAPQRRLTLSQIYKWISDTYSFYGANDAGWQNSIRHNLSLNKAFIKQERPKDDPGKGNYWAIEPGMEQQFMKEKPSRRATNSMDNVPIMSTRIEPAQFEPTIFHDGLPTLPEGLPSLPPVLSVQNPMYSQACLAQQTPAHAAPEVSSDATIPLSDNAITEEQADRGCEQELPLEGGLYSPLPATMHSSPPIPRHLENRSNTPPPVSHGPGSSGTRAHKRKYASMDASLDDSGYISSLDSSVMRSNQGGRLLTSEADRPRIKRGRAEEEIARLRASSYDSPSKGRSYGFAPPSSSPLRQGNEANRMPPPLTPAIKMRKPLKPPASVSPNTNLRLHRENVSHMLNSPLRRVSNLSEEAIPWSPAFQIDDASFNLNDFVADPVEFDIFQDGSFDSFFSFADNGSPVKRSAKRARMDRTQSASALGELTESAMNKTITSAPFLRAPNSAISMKFDTPSKAFEGLSSPSKVFLAQSPIAMKKGPTGKEDWASIEDFCATHFFEDGDEGDGLDILQGFEKIGGSQKQGESSRASKPPFGRSYTTAF